MAARGVLNRLSACSQMQTETGAAGGMRGSRRRPLPGSAPDGDIASASFPKEWRAPEATWCDPCCGKCKIPRLRGERGISLSSFRSESRFVELHDLVVDR